MTAQEKAMELVENFFKIQDKIKFNENQYYSKSRESLEAEMNEWNNDYWKALAIKSALIAVDEIFESLDEHHWQNRNVTEYYREVKQEIEKL